MSQLLTVQDITVGHGDVIAVRDASLALDEGELVVVLGANGAGKSSLMAAIMGWLPLRSGAVLLAGERISALDPWQRARRGIALVPEGGRLFGDLTVDENLKLVRATDSGLSLALDLFPALQERLHQVSSTLSGGERQMLALARAIATEPRLLLVDEASTGLMPVLVDRLFEVLRQLREDGLPILLVEQNTRALHIADRGYVMEAGQIVREGTSEELAVDPEVRRAYLGQ